MKAITEHNWMKLLDPEWKGAATTTECMGLMTSGWGDESHPDTAIGYQFSAYILGVVPLEPGFRRFQVRPLPIKEVSWAKGLVPTPHGLRRDEDGARPSPKAMEVALTGSHRW